MAQETVATERHNRIMLKKLIGISAGKQSQMRFRRISVESAPEFDDYNAKAVQQLAMPDKRIGPVSLNFGNRQKEHHRIMKENALIAKRLSQ